MSLKIAMGIFSLGAVLFSGGCQSAKPGAEKDLPKPLEGMVWEMMTYRSVNGTMNLKVHKSMVYMEIKDGTLSGNAGANRFFGGIEVDGSSITIFTTGSSMMMGTPELMAQEGQFLKLLQLSSRYQIVDDELRLQDEEGRVVLVFVPRVEPDLTANIWNATGVNNGRGGVTSVLQGSEITAEFSVEGRVSGSSGCNAYSGGYELEGKSIVFTPISGTRKMCAEPPGIMEQELNFLQALEKSGVYSIREGRLELRDAAGALQVSFSAVNE